jgi:hypothetical protein
METHTVQKIVDGASLNDARASPKSHIFSLQSALASIFFGFKSRWKTFAAEKRRRKLSDHFFKNQRKFYHRTMKMEAQPV